MTEHEMIVSACRLLQEARSGAISYTARAEAWSHDRDQWLNAYEQWEMRQDDANEA